MLFQTVEWVLEEKKSCRKTVEFGSLVRVLARCLHKTLSRTIYENKLFSLVRPLANEEQFKYDDFSGSSSPNGTWGLSGEEEKEREKETRLTSGSC